MNYSSYVENNAKKTFFTAYHMILLLLAVAGASSIYFWSRFTVDDAFISWAYGKNLVHFGQWSYSPGDLLPAEGYTSPFYAIASALPEMLSIDVVLFFKIFSLLIFIYTLWRVYDVAGKYSALVGYGFIVSPIFVLHTFSGLDTILFGVVVFESLYALQEKKYNRSVLLSCFSVFVRPEGMVLAVLVWLVSFISCRERCRGALIVSAVSIVALFAFRLFYFELLLPNTFYVKAGSGYFDTFYFFANIYILLIPLILLKPSRSYADNAPYLVLILFSLCTIFVYANSSLSMDYADRFFVHVLTPVLLFSITSKSTGRFQALLSSFPKRRRASHIATSLFMSFFFLFPFYISHISNWRGLVHLSVYYPRILDAHAATGNALNEHTINNGDMTLVFGDAGMLSYLSNWEAIDYIGLASREVTQGDLGEGFLSEQSPDLLIFHARPDTGVRIDSHNIRPVFEYGIKHSYAYLCDVMWNNSYTLAIYAHPDYNNTEISEDMNSVCEYSERNNINNTEYFKKVINVPFWEYWTTKNIQ